MKDEFNRFVMKSRVGQDPRGPRGIYSRGRNIYKNGTYSANGANLSSAALERLKQIYG